MLYKIFIKVEYKLISEKKL